MSTTVENIEVRRPTAQMLPELYRLLGEVFEPDRPLMDCVREGSVVLTEWDHFVVCRVGRILAHAALVRMPIWFAGRLHPVAGIASVFTLPEHRRTGLARRVLNAALAAADAQAIPCVLFTSLPQLYERFGFRVIDQGYLRTTTAVNRLERHGHELTETTLLHPEQIEQMADLYTNGYANHDGKLRRDPAYWPFYRAIFNGRSALNSRSNRQDICLCFCTSEKGPAGYIRIERNGEAALVTELCARADALDVAESLLSRVFDWAARQDLPFVSFALPETHPAWGILARRGIETVPDDAGPYEAFMARPGAGDEWLLRLRWSLADKF